MLPMDESILWSLADLRGVNIIIRPHPLLLEPSACGGKDWMELFRAIASPRVRIHAGPGTSVYDVLPISAVLLTDMSSVLFEYLLLDRPILLYVCDQTFRQYAADAFIPMIRQATTPVTQPSGLSALAHAAIDHPERLRAARMELTSMFFYNVGSATAHCVRAIYDTLGIESWNDTEGDRSLSQIPETSGVG
jgi:CDP-glycerol glycerophosphotransferase (TagB/SpsB family)